MDPLELIETERTRRHLGHAKLAAAIGLSRQHWEQVRAGKCRLKPKHLDALAVALSLDEFGRNVLHLAAARAAGYRV